MQLGSLLKSIEKKHKRISIKGISFDSRKVKKNDIFFAIKGNKTSGSKFINKALLKKASAIVSSKNKKQKNSKIPLV